MPKYLTGSTVQTALATMPGTVAPMFWFWLVLKAVGLKHGRDVEFVGGKNSPFREPILQLFGYGHPNKGLLIPWNDGADGTRKARFRNGNAKESGVDHFLRQGMGSQFPNFAQGQIRQSDPSEYLRIFKNARGAWCAAVRQNYPRGLGFGPPGFAPTENQRARLPFLALAVWYARQSPLPEGEEPGPWLRSNLQRELHLSAAESALVFDQDLTFDLEISDEPLTDNELHTLATGSPPKIALTQAGSMSRYEYNGFCDRIGAKVGRIRWMETPPEETLTILTDANERAILLYGPPRTGKTFLVDQRFPRTLPSRVTIQIHDGWGYDELILGKSIRDFELFWTTGPLLKAIRRGWTEDVIIVLEEINRADIQQSLGEVFSLVEEGYRGEANALQLADGSDFWIAPSTIFIFTMNNLDTSTYEVDDALFGRIAAVEMLPRTDSLLSMLQAEGVDAATIDRISKLQTYIVAEMKYELGHGYWKGFCRYQDKPTTFVHTRIWPVLHKHFSATDPGELERFGHQVQELFGA